MNTAKFKRNDEAMYDGKRVKIQRVRRDRATNEYNYDVSFVGTEGYHLVLVLEEQLKPAE